ncbi:unnamed protein product, partial [Meganyctiphanes norvegica]
MRLSDVICILLFTYGVSSQRATVRSSSSRHSKIIPQDGVEDNSLSSHLLDLLPEFSTAIDDLASKPGNLQPLEMIFTLFPIIHKAMEAQVNGTNQPLSDEDEANMAMTITVIELSVKSMGELMSPKHSSDVGNVITSLLDMSGPIVEANAKREGRPMKKVEKEFLYYFENGFKFFIESMNDFTKEITPENMVKASSKVSSYVLGARAKAEGRQISYEEKEAIKHAEDQIITTIDIMRGFYGNPGIKDLTDTFMQLMNFIMNSKARSELPRRWALTWQEKQMINRTDTALRNLASLISDIHASSTTSEEMADFGQSTVTLWEAQVEKEERELAPEEIRYLQFTNRIINLPKSIYKAVV